MRFDWITFRIGVRTTRPHTKHPTDEIIRNWRYRSPENRSRTSAGLLGDLKLPFLSAPILLLTLNPARLFRDPAHVQNAFWRLPFLSGCTHNAFPPWNRVCLLP